MSFYRFNRYVALLVFACSFLLLSACATTGSGGNQIEARSTARWDAFLAGDLERAYQYLSPGYRSSVTLAQYQRSVLLQQLKYTSAKYIESECDDSKCDVTVSVGFTVYGALPGVKSFDGTRNIHESWVLVDGNWYMVPAK